MNLDVYEKWDNISVHCKQLDSIPSTYFMTPFNFNIFNYFNVFYIKGNFIKLFELDK